MKLTLIAASAATATAFPTLKYVASSSVEDTNPTHYGNPFSGDCMSDEVAIQIQGIDGGVCTPKCSGSTCPSDVPDKVTASPMCALQDTSSNKFCALICSPSTEERALRAGDSQCGDAKCRAISGVGICTYDQPSATLEDRFATHVRVNGLSFDEDEFNMRQSIFAENEKMIAKHNAEQDDYVLEMNEYGHLTNEEFHLMYTGLKVPENDDSIPRETFVNSGASVSSSVDWTTKGAVTDVKNQGQCGSCWAFSTTGSIEGAYFLKTGKLQSFSEQQLVSCDHSGDQGCNGGIMETAFKWIESNGGLCAEDDYPYTSGSGSTGSCKTKCTVVDGSTPSSFVDVAPDPQTTPASVDDMMAAVESQPVSVAINAAGTGFQFYKSGVFTSKCGTQLDHGVLVVGYGTDGGKDYWKVKNSWGGSWGEEGYIRLEKGNSQKGGQCGILLSPCYPKL